MARLRVPRWLNAPPQPSVKPQKEKVVSPPRKPPKQVVKVVKVPQRARPKLAKRQKRVVARFRLFKPKVQKSVGRTKRAPPFFDNLYVANRAQVVYFLRQPHV